MLHIHYMVIRQAKALCFYGFCTILTSLVIFGKYCEHYRRHQGISRRIVQGAKGMSRSIYLRHLKDQISTGLVFIRVDHDSLKISP